MDDFELSIDHPMLNIAKIGFDMCLKRMVARAIETGSMEGTATLKVSFDISEETDKETGEVFKQPQISYKVNFSVPMKYGTDGKIIEKSRLVDKREGGWILVGNQISMDELLKEKKK